MKRNKGLILILMLIVAAALTIMVGAFSKSIFYRNQLYMHNLNSVKAYCLASSGINYGRGLAKYDYKNNIWTVPGDIDLSGMFADNIVRLKFETIGPIVTIRSTATVRGITQVITCKVEGRPDAPDATTVVEGWGINLK